ncbi:MAG: tetratricopeptide repeat protein [Bacteroidales bacterium]|jgi:tetratricopeptide (TPR) repeat protein|nr:tetratricopeptide repeat protein [Bacteroidales bacterium]
MSKKKSDKAEVRVEGVEHALTKAEQFLETYQKHIMWAVGIILAIVVLYMAFQRYYVEKRSNEAAEQMFPAEQYFESDNWELALDGDGNNLGFVDIVSDYKFTPSANLAKYYAGICYLNLGEYESAVDYLAKFKSKDIILSSIALGGIGDAYAGLEDIDKAISFYKKAADNKKNEFTTPLYLLRAGILLEQQGRYKEAAESFNRIKKEYSSSTEGRSIDKYLTRVEIKQQQGS